MSKIYNLVIAATEEDLVTVDWLRTMQVCEQVNLRDEGPKEVIKAFKRRMFHKNPKVIILTMKVLESCVIHCGNRFHLKVAGKEFLPEYVKLLQMKNLAAPVRKKGLSLLQVWSTAFGAKDAGLSPITEAFTNLKKTMTFPPLEMDLVAQIVMDDSSDAAQNSKKVFADLAAKEAALGGDPSAADDEDEIVDDGELTMPDMSDLPDDLEPMDDEAMAMMQEILGLEKKPEFEAMAAMLMDLKELPPPPKSSRRDRKARQKLQAAQPTSTGAAFASDADFDAAFKK